MTAEHRRYWWSGALLLGALILLPSPVAAATRAGLAATDLFALADQARKAGEINDAIQLYDALARDPDDDIRAEARFRKGMMLADVHRYADAAVAFRALLDDKPDALRVRLELARVLAAAGDEAGARRNLRQAPAGQLPADVALAVAQFANALRSTKRLGGSFEVALAPDTNINRATAARTLDTVVAPLTLSDDARARSGIGARLTAQGFAKLAVTDDLSILPRLAGAASLYRQRAFDDVSGSALIGLEWQHLGARWSPSVGETWRWYGGHLYARTDTAALDWLHRLGSRTQLAASGSISRAAYVRNDLQNGMIYDLNLTAEHALGLRSGMSLTLSGTRQTARDPGYATTAGGGSMLVWRDLDKTTVFASLNLRRTIGDARLFLFPNARREWLISGRAGATFRGLAVRSFAPLIRFGYECNISTVGIYDYRRAAGEVGLTHAF